MFELKFTCLLIVGHLNAGLSNQTGCFETLSFLAEIAGQKLSV